MALRTGLAATTTLVVTDADTAPALGSGDVAVFGTPRLIALCEEATCLAVRNELPEGDTTVGMRVQLDHLAPTKVGATAVADVVLEKIDGRRLTFTVSVRDERGLVAAGRITRVIVNAERFLKKAQ